MTLGGDGGGGRKVAAVGISVKCAVCGLSKNPHGRSAPFGYGGCDDECPGYAQEPLPGCLWPGETSYDFGYQHCDHSTRPMTDADRKKHNDEEP